MTRLKTSFYNKFTTFWAAILMAALFSAPSFSQTQVRLQSNSDLAGFSEGYKLSLEDWSAQTKLAKTGIKSPLQRHSQDRPQVWISNIGTLLFDDFDGDGYHSGFSMTIDVDSEYGDTEVYANIYLQSPQNPLILLHKTSQFTVYSSTIGDEYRVDTKLRNNFAEANYDVMVDIHDAWSDQLLNTVNARGFSNLRGLPLESADQYEAQESLSENSFDLAPENPFFDDLDQTKPDDVFVTEFAGASHPYWLLILSIGWLARRRQANKSNRNSLKRNAG